MNQVESCDQEIAYLLCLGSDLDGLSPKALPHRDNEQSNYFSSRVGVEAAEKGKAIVVRVLKLNLGEVWSL